MDIDALHKLTLSERDEASVTVNQRSLIDKILSRYSSENTLLRELIQNADDADAKTVVLRYESVAEPATGHSEDLNKRMTRRLTVKNDGQKFRPEDWMRLARIAEGNPADGRIGAYGVGFYAVFSLCDEPFIVSGDQSLAMYWRNDQLFTRTAKLPVNDDWTTFSLNMREPVEIPQLKNLTRFLANALAFSRSVSKLELWLDSALLCSLTRIASPTSPVSTASLATTTQGKLLRIKSVESASVQITATYENITQSVAKPDGLGKFLSFFKETPKAISGTSTSTIFLRTMTAHLSSALSNQFAKELQRATKKAPPKQTQVQIVTMSRAEHEASTPAAIFEQLQAYPNQGRVYIGFPTHQTTGFSGHIGAPCLIPTVERESIDLVDRFVKVWNFEVLRAVGLLARIAYHHEFATVKSIEDALFVTKYFSMQGATPLRIDAPVEESFFEASTTLPLFTSSGVQPSTLARLPEPAISFLKSVPVLPLSMLREPFIQKLQTLGLVEAISIRDIRQDLQSRILTNDEAVQFLQYCSLQAQQMDREAIHALLGAALMDTFNAGTIKTWSQPSTFPAEAPLPATTLPTVISRKLSEDAMRSLGWSELRMLDWVEHCAKVEAFGRPPPLEQDAELANLVLATVSKSFDKLNPVDRSEIVRLLQQRKCVPTRNHGLQKPGETYFVHSKLFEDLPLIQCKGVKDKFLAALGVRRTIELDLIFNRLVKGGTWTAYDLVLYLASVRRDIPASDIEKLKKTPIAESETSTEKQRASALYEPHETLRQLGLPIIKWPKDKWKPFSEEASLLYALGLHKFPPPMALVALMATAEPVLFERAMSYFVLNFAVYGYGASYQPGSSPAFVPTMAGPRKKPLEVFADPAAATFGFDVLRRDLVPSAALLGVQKLPATELLIVTMVQSPMKDIVIARQQFELLSTLPVNGVVLDQLSTRAIIPTAKGFVSPSRCFFKSSQIEPWLGQLFELVDFGVQANQFLKLIGVRDQPSTVQITGMLVDDAQQIYTLCGSEDRYRLLLLRIAREFDAVKRDGHLVTRLKQSPVLIAHKYKLGEQEDVVVSSLRSANEIVLIDDFTAFTLFKGDVHSCPQDAYLEELYATLGAVKLSSIVTDSPSAIGWPISNQATATLREAILERVTVFLADHGIRPRHDISWLTRHLQITMHEKVSMRRMIQMRSTQVTRHQHTTAIVDGEARLLVSHQPDYYDVAQAICKIMLPKPKPRDYLLLESLLSNSLDRLKSRGYNVNRILQRQEKLKRERDEQQQKLLAEEARLAELSKPESTADVQPPLPKHETVARQPQSAEVEHTSPVPPMPAMPGAFPRPGLFSNIKKSLGLKASDSSSTALTESSSTSKQASPAPSPIASHASVDAALQEAVRATRASDATSVFSRPQADMVQEAKVYCDTKPATNLVLFASMTNGLKLFVEREVDVARLRTGDLAASASSFAVLLESLAACFECNANVINLFYDHAGSTIAFNKGGTIYCNLRYYHELQHSTRQDGKAYWYVTLAHEIAHNLVSEHSSEHEFYTESLIVSHLAKLVSML